MRRRTARRRTLAGAALLALLGPAGSGAQSLHGALAPAEQLALLEKLDPVSDVGKPPPQIDFVLWKELVPADNQMTPDGRLRLVVAQRDLDGLRLGARAPAPEPPDAQQLT